MSGLQGTTASHTYGESISADLCIHSYKRAYNRARDKAKLENYRLL
jgi:hypothetical protein